MSKSVHVTLSISKDLKDRLYSSIEKGSISKFVSESLEKSLLEKQKQLADAYKEAAKDLGQLEGRSDWQDIAKEDFQGVDWENE